MIASETGSTFTLGKFTIRIGLRPDNPAFPRYLVFLGDDLVGKQFSRPCLSDCEWLHRTRGVYATQSRPPSAFTMYRRGRPTNAERARRAALEVEDLAA